MPMIPRNGPSPMSDVNSVTFRSILASLSFALDSRRSRGLLRSLPQNPPPLHDFSSNDYLGLSRDPTFHKMIDTTIQKYHKLNNVEESGSSSTGSRLLSGNMPCLSDLEATAAAFHKSEDALVFGNGYMACLGLIGCVATNREDVFVVDEFVHASCWDGRKLSRATEWLTFRHGDVGHMKEIVKGHLNDKMGKKGNVFVVVESVYSMGGRGGKVGAILQACEEIVQEGCGGDVMVIIDEAHACGIYGPKGEGKVVELGLEKHPRLLARVITFGKGFGCYGALIVGSRVLKDYLLNYARSVIYSTAVPVAVAGAMRAVYSFMDTPESASLRRQLRGNIRLLKRLAAPVLMDSNEEPVQAVLVAGNKRCTEVGAFLKQKNFAVSSIRSPTVPVGKERLRIIVHAFNNRDEIVTLVRTLKEALKANDIRLCRL